MKELNVPIWSAQGFTGASVTRPAPKPNPITVQLKTRAECKANFERHGLSISVWALQRGFNPTLVSAILNDDDLQPKRRCTRGESHNIAVTLGLKHGEIAPMQVEQGAQQ